MPAFDPAIDNLIVSATGSLEDANHVNPRDVLARLLISLGFNGMIVAGASPAVPANARSLWWDTNVSQPKRYNPLTSQWVNLTTDHYALHVFQRAINAAGVDTALETGDLFPFFDVSRNETRAVTEATLRGLINSQVNGIVTSSATEFIIDLTTLEASTHYVFYGVMQWNNVWSVGDAPPITMRIRTSANANITFTHRIRESGNSFIRDTAAQFKGPRHSASTDPLNSPTAIPLQFGLMVHQSPRMVSLNFVNSEQAMSGFAESDPGTAAAKVHFTIPAGVIMNGKVMKP